MKSIKMENTLSDYSGFDALNFTLQAVAIKTNYESIKTKNGNRLQRSKLRTK